MNTKQAKSVAFGSTPPADLDEYYDAWQWLYDNNIELKEPDIRFLDKLICDGMVVPKDNYTYNEKGMS